VHTNPSSRAARRLRKGRPTSRRGGVPPAVDGAAAPRGGWGGHVRYWGHVRTGRL
jgi:hypothetical protein